MVEVRWGWGGGAAGGAGFRVGGVEELAVGNEGVRDDEMSADEVTMLHGGIS